MKEPKSKLTKATVTVFVLAMQALAILYVLAKFPLPALDFVYAGY